jgi:SagB-type dehydrogenase family enzyme
MTSLRNAEPRYVAEGRRAQALLDQGRAAEAVAAFVAVLGGLEGEVGYGRAVVLERLGRALIQAGDHAAALVRLQEALELAGRLAPSIGVRRLRCALRSGLGDALRAAGRPGEARRAYLAALEIGRELRDPRSQGVDQARLGALALAEGDAPEALRRYRASLDLVRELREPAVEAVAWHELGRVHRRLGDLGEAVRCHREAAECERRAGASPRLARHLLALAELLEESPDGAEEANAVASDALAVAQAHDPLAPEVWAAYGVLGEIHPERAELRELARRAPLVAAAARRLGPEPGLGHAVIFARLGQCFAAGGRPDLADGYLRQAIGTAETLRGVLPAELLGMLRNEPSPPVELPPATPGPPPVTATIEEAVTDYAFDPNLLLDGPRTRRLAPPAAPSAIPEDTRPVLVPGTRTWLDPEGRIRLAPPADEPEVTVDGACTVLRRVSREVVVTGGAELLWRMLGLMDGRSTWEEIRALLPPPDHAAGARLLGELVSAGAVDLSNRPVGRFVHWSTRKGVLPAGGLEGDEAFHLAADAATSAAGARRLPLDATVPPPLRSFHALTRARRSTRDYRGGAVRREELDALLSTACGVTGTLRWSGGELALRAYPSSGALYSVGIYPVAFRVEGLEPSVHRFHPDGPALEPIRPTLDPAVWIAAALPMEREMMAGVAVMICLTGVFDRHERKYGEGGYRMLVAEAGHVSQNLVLAATALGLGARPFGGVFDSLVNRALGVDQRREQFLLSVLVGR